MGKRDCETVPRYYKMGQFSKTDAASVDERCNLVLENLSSSSSKSVMSSMKSLKAARFEAFAGNRCFRVRVT